MTDLFPGVSVSVFKWHGMTQIQGSLFGGPYNKIYSMLGFM